MIPFGTKNDQLIPIFGYLGFNRLSNYYNMRVYTLSYHSTLDDAIMPKHSTGRNASIAKNRKMDIMRFDYIHDRNNARR